MKSPIRIVLLLFLAWMTGCASMPSQPPLQAAKVDVDRYLGRWYVIANIPYSLERGHVAPWLEYRRRPDGRIDDLYHYRDAFGGPEKLEKGLVWIPDPSRPAHWKERVIWPFTSDLVIMAVAPDYHYAMVGTPDRSKLWIFARKPSLAGADYQILMKRARHQGFETAQVKKFPQTPAQVGKYGYQ